MTELAMSDQHGVFNNNGGLGICVLILNQARGHDITGCWCFSITRSHVDVEVSSVRLFFFCLLEGASDLGESLDSMDLGGYCFKIYFGNVIMILLCLV